MPGVRSAAGTRHAVLPAVRCRAVRQPAARTAGADRPAGACCTALSGCPAVRGTIWCRPARCRLPAAGRAAASPTVTAWRVRRQGQEEDRADRRHHHRRTRRGACRRIRRLGDSGTQSAQTQSTSQQSGKTKSGDSKAAKDDKPCTAAPDAELSSVDHSDANLVAQLQLTSNCASTKDGDTAEFKESDVKVSIKDDDGNVIASAVFDFSKQPVKFNGETANVALEFTTRQYWRPYDQIETGSAEVILQTGQSGTGEAGSADGDALAGSDIDSEDAERYAQLALSWQLKHDESAASRFYTTYTTQLSSKKNDMKADGKTWHYVDIYEQFLQQRIKHKNAILIWSGDYPTYTKADASTAYYVILSGDTVDSVKAGDAWCKSNGYGAADCAVVDLQ